MRTKRCIFSCFLGLAALTLSACNTADRAPEPKADPAAQPAAAPAGVLRLGAAIDPSTTNVPLATIAKSPNQFSSGAFTTTGTITAVCQHRGCWMEIKDDQSDAHVRVAGHSFAIPRTASGKKARVSATLVHADDPETTCADHGGMEAMGGDSKGGGQNAKNGCNAEAESQMGHPLAKLELEANGVEILD